MTIIDKADPCIDYVRLRELAEEFTQHWKRLQAFYLDAASGFALVRRSVEAEQARARSYVKGTELDSVEFQDTRQFTYAEIFAEGFCTSGIHQACQGGVKARNAPNGANFTTLGQLCVVSFFDYWDDYLRPEYCIAIGKLQRDAKLSPDDRKKILRDHGSIDLWGDLGLIRNAIVHNRGVATENMGRCKLIKWFKRGEEIALTPMHMRAILMALLTYRNELFKQQFPEQRILL